MPGTPLVHGALGDWWQCVQQRQHQHTRACCWPRLGPAAVGAMPGIHCCRSITLPKLLPLDIAVVKGAASVPLISGRSYAANNHPPARVSPGSCNFAWMAEVQLTTSRNLSWQVHVCLALLYSLRGLVSSCSRPEGFHQALAVVVRGVPSTIRSFP